MRSPSFAIAWEIWGASRQAFLVAFAVLPGFALFYYLFADFFQRSELLRAFSYLPMVISLLFLFVAFNPKQGLPASPRAYSRCPSALRCWSRARWPTEAARSS